VITRLRHNQRFVTSGVLLQVMLAFAVVGPLLPGRDNPYREVGGLYDHPSLRFPLGTDNFGHDILTQLMFGTRTSLMIGLLAGVIATMIGVAVGTLAGFRGGFLEELLMGTTNVIIAIPGIVILILLSVALGTRSVATMAVVIGVTGWPWTARAVRAQASSLRTREHVDVARLSGERTVGLIVFEIIPYMLSYIFMAFVLQVAGALLNEVALSLLGLGLTNTVSLGIMLFWALLWESVRTGAVWAFLPPVFVLTVIVFLLYVLQSSLDEVFNPRLRRGASIKRRDALVIAPTPTGASVAVPVAAETDPVPGGRP
jgi:peptide/nickel transport system permease protein